MEHDDTRPRVALAMASSINGVIDHPLVRSLGSGADRHRFELLRAQADVVLYGAETIRTNGGSFRFAHPELEGLARSRGSLPAVAVLCTRDDFDYSAPFWSSPTSIIVVRIASPDAPRHVVPEPIETIRLDPGSSLRAVLGALAARGHRRILCAGGGRIASGLLTERLVDEVFLTLTPWMLDGSSISSMLYGGRVLTTLSLVSCQAQGDEVFLRYRTHGRPPWPRLEDTEPSP